MISYQFNETRKNYEIAKFDETLIEVDEFIKKTIPSDLIIQDDFDKKAVAHARTLIRAKIKEVASLRKEVTKALLGEFQNQCKAIEKKLSECDMRLRGSLDDYTNKTGKPSLAVLQIKTDKMEILVKIMEICRENEIYYDLKEN